MCGIGGFVDFERDARRGGPILHGMKRTLTPRGPDAEGTYFDEDAALVHRRLIVIDPDGGQQPMAPTGILFSFITESYITPWSYALNCSRAAMPFSAIRTPKCCSTLTSNGEPRRSRA